jgi:hypothetical protein
LFNRCNKIVALVSASWQRLPNYNVRRYLRIINTFFWSKKNLVSVTLSNLNEEKKLLNSLSTYSLQYKNKILFSSVLISDQQFLYYHINYMRRKLTSFESNTFSCIRVHVSNKVRCNCLAKVFQKKTKQTLHSQKGYLFMNWTSFSKVK